MLISIPPARRRWSLSATAASCALGYDPVLYGNYLLIHGEARTAAT